MAALGSEAPNFAYNEGNLLAQASQLDGDSEVGFQHSAAECLDFDLLAPSFCPFDTIVIFYTM